MPLKLSTDKVKNYIKEIHPNAICLFDNYLGNRHKLLLLCENGHEFKIRLGSIKKGGWCGECYRNKKITIDQIKDYLNIKYPKAICLSTEYVSYGSKLDLICENNHKFKISYSKIKAGNWCAECAGLKKHTIDYVKQYIETKHPNTTFLFDEYKNARTKLKMICSNGHNYEATFDNIIHNKWCKQCAGLVPKLIDEVKEIIVKKYPGTICNFTEYKNISQKLNLTCANGHNFNIKFSKFQIGQWCRTCAGLDTKPVDYVKSYIDKYHPNSICTFDNYKNTKSIINIICDKGHSFISTFKNIKNGKWCPLCANNRKKTKEEIYNLILQIHPKAIVDLNSIKNARIKLDIICEKGHKFKINYDNIKQGQWCAECAGVKKYTVEYVKDFITKMHPGTICNFTEYKSNSSKLDLICSKGHKYKASFSKIKNGKWCSKCSKFRSENYIRDNFEKLTGKSFDKIKPPWLINDKTNYPLELDGFNEELKIAFECQGEQHYKLTKKFHRNNIKKFEYQQYKDELKKKLCENNGVKLICIPAINVKIAGKIYKETDIYKIIKDFLIKNDIIA